MHPRRSGPLALAVLLITTGCVAVPPTPDPAPPGKPAGLAPAAVRPPAPLPAWPAPTQARPRETLADTEPDGHDAADRNDERNAGAPRTHDRTAQTPPEPRRSATPRRQQPKAAAPKQKKQKRSRAQTPKHTPQRPPAADLRSLCRQAGPSGVVPPGVVALCRDTYGP